MAFDVCPNVRWVGQIDWELRKFHGEEYTTKRGSTYNSYLVRDGKTALIDTVWGPFGDQFVENLRREIDLNELDFVVANHAESDHSGALPALMKLIPDKPVYCTANAVKSLKGHYHADWNFQVVKTGQRLSLGRMELVFIEAPMLHWPDSMFCYLTEAGVLFSNDAFGQHVAAQRPFNDLVDQCELYQEAIKYYANILTPFSKMVAKKIEEVVGFNLPVNMICPSHGVIWRDDPLQIVNQYAKWAADYQENQVTVIYDTMWNGTRRMAEAIAQGLSQADERVTVKVCNCARGDWNDIITEVFRSKAIVVGSPTMNRGLLHAVAGLLEMIRGLQFKNKKAAAFGAYGWSGESVKLIAGRLQEAGFALVDDGLREMWNPDQPALERCLDYGRSLAAKFD
ncbi:flavodoxin/nitric oxide synthase [Desulfarculus baarsii DSM 2075]|uniref:Flavodoxin/nitric oxide synthase n=1 Tax=Desulfarculus baarsii (strain ATCC 33931 / DSM 2075 / LMG 7858 / VKM B-1802 / 2st14) TaxID=644282 RepID=E1QMD5_DESB2|nr:anaerobic nitric oxide reductase flavorubredoxin [Desulfarculus baarsii]ADK86178.1 flavodoxin/nitric oxide synthase [Desulfarculus baarsii DSM 2075]